jgi:hypothetical protein
LLNLKVSACFAPAYVWSCSTQDFTKGEQVTKLNFLTNSLIVCFITSFLVACNFSAAPTPTATPLPNALPSNIPTESALIAGTGGFFALSVANINTSAKWFQKSLV